MSRHTSAKILLLSGSSSFVPTKVRQRKTSKFWYLRECLKGSLFRDYYSPCCIAFRRKTILVLQSNPILRLRRFLKHKRD
jgi:hypothetical protein